MGRGRMMRWLVVFLCSSLAGCSFDEGGTSATADGGTPDAPAIDATMPDGPMLPFASCASAHLAMPSAGSGTYMLQIGTESVAVYCDMEHFGGGWTLVQRTVWDFGSSATLITGYMPFYQQTVGTPPGTEAYRLAGRFWAQLNS